MFFEGVSPDKRIRGGAKGLRKGREDAEKVNASESDSCVVRDKWVNLTVEYEPASILMC